MPDTVRETFGLACPDCGRDDHIAVTITAQATLTAEGTDVTGDHEWDDDSPCSCFICDTHKTVKEFSIANGGQTNA